METKQIPSKLLYCTEKVLTIPEIAEFSAAAMDSLCQDASASGLEIIGSPEFLYLNCGEDMEKPFQLIITLPVKEQKPSENEQFFFLETMPFECVSKDYKGAMAGIGNAWEAFVHEILGSGYLMSNEGREVYKGWISPDSEENVTELQMGILARKRA